MTQKEYLRSLIDFASRTMSEPKEYSNCYVAFLDILGFQNIALQWPVEKLKNIFDEIRKRVIAINTDLYKNMISGDTRERMNIVIMSDSIIISAHKKDQDAFLSIIVLAMQIQYFLLEKGILIRGGISQGDFLHYADITFGPALIRAYQLENSKAHNSRIVIDEELVFDLTVESDNTQMLRTFIKQDEDGYRYLDSLKFLFICQTAQIEDKCRNISKFITKSLRDFADDDNQLIKYEWLKNYYNSTLDFFVGIIDNSVIERCKVTENEK